MPDPFLLAAAGGGSGTPIALLILALAGFAIAYFVVGPGRRSGPKRNADIPLAMRPYHSDEELETTGMERAMAWGVALAVFASLFLPLYWLIEPTRINNAVDHFYEQDVAAGRTEFQNACAGCHGVDLGGGSAPHPDPDIDTAWPAPPLNNIVARYQDSEIVDDVQEFILATVANGRPGTPMQAFGVANGGSYSDQQLEAIAAYILSVQTGEPAEAESFAGASEDDVFAANCARCHGADAEGYVGPQLTNVFERYGWVEGDEESLEEARAAVRHTIENGRFVPPSLLMPPFGDTLSDGAIDSVMEHLESLQVTDGPRFGQLGGPPGSEDEGDTDGAEADAPEGGNPQADTGTEEAA